MAITFPLSPVTNDEYTFSGITWKWNGYAWNKISGTGTGGSGATWTRQNDIFPETIGGIQSGTTLANGTNAIQVLESLLYPYQTVSFTLFSTALSTSYEVGQTAGSSTNTASWNTSGPTGNWVVGSLSISANQSVGTLVSSLDYDDSPIGITHSAYNFTSPTTLTFTISGQQDQGSNAARNQNLSWQYKYFSGKTGEGFTGSGLTGQGFVGAFRTTPNDYTTTFAAVSPANKAYYVIPEEEISGSLTFTDTGTNLNFPFTDGGTFGHVNPFGLNVVYHLYESTNNFAGEVSVKVST
tara:strand:+ start:9420 stop:10307 length:888 start_codon:yes stop_codon:yes gene_type:complete